MNIHKLYAIFSKGMVATLLISGPLFAESPEETTKQERILVGDRAISQTEKEEIAQEKGHIFHKIEKGEFVNEENLTLSDAEKREISGQRTEDEASTEDSNFVKKGLKGLSYYSTHAGAYHFPVAVSFLGDNVELEDGSVYSVYSGDRYQTLNWMTGDIIVIVPNADWLSVYDYKLVNLNTGANVRVNLVLGPVYNGVFTHWIVGIDYYFGEIILEDGSFWSMSSFDSSVYTKWLPNDTIIIGTNDGWLSGSNPNILINVNTNSHAIGSCLN